MNTRNKIYKLLNLLHECNYYEMRYDCNDYYKFSLSFYEISKDFPSLFNFVGNKDVYTLFIPKDKNSALPVKFITCYISYKAIRIEEQINIITFELLESELFNFLNMKVKRFVPNIITQNINKRLNSVRLEIEKEEHESFEKKLFEIHNE